MPSLFSHSSLHSIKRASCPCPDYPPAINMINMRVGVMWYRASHARRLWQTEHTAGGIQEGKNERGSRGGWLEAENAQLRVPPFLRGLISNSGVWSLNSIYSRVSCTCTNSLTTFEQRLVVVNLAV